jgi:hypothetical protein
VVHPHLLWEQAAILTQSHQYGVTILFGAKPTLRRHPSLDAQVFEAFYREHLGLIYRYVYRKVGNQQEAEDLTSSIFLKAVRSLQQEACP